LAHEHSKYTKRIEHALIKYVRRLDSEVNLALNSYFNLIEKAVHQIEDYRLKVSPETPHILLPLSLLGTYRFNVEKLYFDVKFNNPFRDDVRILFSSKIMIPAISLNLPSFVTVHRWTRKRQCEDLESAVDEDRMLIIERGSYSILNFYYFDSMTCSEIYDADYLNMILKDMLIFLALLPVPSLNDKCQAFCRSLPFLSMYGSDISGVEALGITRCLLKLDRKSLESAYFRRASIRSLLWGRLPFYKVRAFIVSNNPIEDKINVLSNEVIYIPELYFMKLLEYCNASALLVDSIVISLFIIKKGLREYAEKLMLFNILAMPINIFPVNDSAVMFAILNYATTSTCSNQIINMTAERKDSLEHEFDINITIREGDLLSKMHFILRAMKLKQLKLSLSKITIKISRSSSKLSNLLGYAYTYLLPFINERSLISHEQKSAISSRCYPPCTILPLISFALAKKFNFKTYKELAKQIVQILSKRIKKNDAEILTTLSDEFRRRGINVKYSEIIALVRNIILAWQLHIIRAKYLKLMLKHQLYGGSFH